MKCLGIATLILLAVRVSNEMDETASLGLYGLLIMVFFVLAFVKMISEVDKSTFQRCPRCHHRDRRGDTVCVGCGYTPKKEMPCGPSS
jgi:hypothetical protein